MKKMLMSLIVAAIIAVPVAQAQAKKSLKGTPKKEEVDKTKQVVEKKDSAIVSPPVFVTPTVVTETVVINPTQKKNLATPEDKSTLYSSLSEEYAKAIDSKILSNYQKGDIVSYRDTIDAVFYAIIQKAALKDAVSLIEKARENWGNNKVEKFNLVMDKPGEKSMVPEKVFKAYKAGFEQLMAKAPRNLSEQSLKELCSLDNIMRYMRKAQTELKKDTDQKFKTMFTVK